MKGKKKVEIFHIRTSPQLKAAAIKRAEEESRSLTSYVENLIRKDIEKERKKMKDDTLKVYHGDTLVCEVLSDQWRPVDELLDICDIDMDEFAKAQGWDDWDWDELHVERKYIDRA